MFNYIFDTRDLSHCIRNVLLSNLPLTICKRMKYDARNLLECVENIILTVCDARVLVLRPWNPSHRIRDAFLINFGNENAQTCETRGHVKLFLMLEQTFFFDIRNRVSWKLSYGCHLNCDDIRNRVPWKLSYGCHLNCDTASTSCLLYTSPSPRDS